MGIGGGMAPGWMGDGHLLATEWPEGQNPTGHLHPKVRALVRREEANQAWTDAITTMCP